MFGPCKSIAFRKVWLKLLTMESTRTGRTTARARRTVVSIKRLHWDNGNLQFDRVLLPPDGELKENAYWNGTLYDKNMKKPIRHYKTGEWKPL